MPAGTIDQRIHFLKLDPKYYFFIPYIGQKQLHSMDGNGIFKGIQWTPRG
jgi:hypothetical protein